MDLLELVLFESPLRLAAFSFAMFAAVLLGRRRWSPTAARYALPVTLAIIVSLFILQTLVTTQRERILHALDAFTDAIEQKDLATLHRTLGTDYDSEDMDHEAIARFIESALESVDVRDVRLRRREVTIEDERAEAIIGGTATLRLRGGIGQIHVSRWRIGWSLEGDAWRIVSIVPEAIDGRPIHSLVTLWRHAR